MIGSGKRSRSITILSAVVAVAFLGVGGAKLIGAQLMVETFDPASTIDFLAANGVTHAGAGTAFHLTYLEEQRARGGAPRSRGGCGVSSAGSR